MRIRGYDIVAVAKKTWSEVGKDKISVYASQMAYSLFFALFPLLLFLAALLSLVADKQTVMTAFDARIAGALPGDVAKLLARTIEQVVFAKGAPGLLSFGLLTAAWSGSSIFGTLRAALNAAYEVEETRPWWKQYALQLGMLVLAGGVTVLATVILLNGEGVVRWLGAHLGLGRVTTIVWTVVQFPLAIGALVAVLWLVYFLLPNCRHQDKRILIVSASIATALWMVATLLFRLYVQKFNALNPAYGAIGAIMVLLTWMYYSSFVLLAVGELAAELQAGTGRVPQPDAVAEPIAGAAVPRRYALIPYPMRPKPGLARSDGVGRNRLGALDWFLPARVVRRTRDRLLLTREWMEEAAANLRRDIAAAQRELGSMIRAIGEGSLLCALGATLGLLGSISFVTGVILVVGDQWLPDDAYAVGALIIAGIAGLTMWFFVRRGVASLTGHASSPGETARPERLNR
jgi:membrane protein